MKTLLLFLALFAALMPDGIAQSVFDRWDKDDDGKLTKAELPPNLRPNFDKADRDGDGFISREEDAAIRRGGRERQQQQQRPGQGGRGAPPLPDGIEHLKDISYAANDNPRQTLDLLLPKKRADGGEDGKPLPLIVFIHGGGWQKGSKESGLRRIAPYVASGDYAGASINYRLTNETQWPKQIHDCKAALRWLRGNAKKYNLAPDKIAVWGTSAGGHLVAMLGVSHHVDGLEGDLGEHDGRDSAVTAVIDYFGPSELLTMDDNPGSMTHNAPDSPEAKLVGAPVQENKDKTNNASPVTHVSGDDAPFLIIHGDRDPLVPFAQSEKLDALLDDAGVESTLIKIEDGGHGRGFPEEELQPLIRAFLDKHLRSADTEVQEAVLPATEPQPELRPR